ncbi:hypothetical protein LPJ61_004887 [Coemansia biformis]|uniref:Uncharacterized protein n=1 Tax=Coemansia biformis TaxID=1286918 RepID=A0A9W7Y417_9FUNG|nr:hypothetical protein LPJ61_004887 [Coemansia biformis]
MQLARLLVILAPALAVPLAQPTDAAPVSLASAPAPAHELTQAEARSAAAQLGREFVDALFELRAAGERRAAAATGGQARAKDDDGDSGDSDDSTTKLINKAARAFRPIVKEMATVVTSALPAGPPRQLVKATADAIDSLMPLILKYALGI